MWADISERRFKEDITSFDGGLAEVLRIWPCRYKFNGQANITANGRHYVGLIADEVEDIFLICYGRWTCRSACAMARSSRKRSPPLRDHVVLCAGQCGKRAGGLRRTT